MSGDVARLLDIAMPPLTILDAGANLLFSNGPFRQLLQIADLEDESNGRLAAFRAQVGDALARTNGGGLMCARVTLDEEHGAVDLTCLPLATTSGSDALFIVLVDDITAWVDRIERAHQAEERLRDFLSCAADWVWEVTASGELTFVSDRLGAMLGRPTVSLLGKDLGTLGRLVEQDAERLSELAVFRSRQPFRDLDFVIERPDGSTLTHLVSGVPVFDQDSGAFLGYRGSGTDISHQIATLQRAHRSELRLSQALTTLRDQNEELERALIDARESSLSKGRFLASMSHELRTPLNAIIGFAEVLKSELHGPVGDTRYANYARDIHVSALRLFKLIGEILDFSALQSDAAMLESLRIRVDREAQLAVDAFADKATEAGVELVLTLDDSPRPVAGDEPALRRVLHNLIDNAIKYTHRGGRVEVAVVGEAAETLVIIRDTGRGIEPEALARVEEAFERPAHSPLHAADGLGLGLAICRRLVGYLNGRMTIDSEPGRGTTITVTLPASDPALPPGRRLGRPI